MIQTLPNQRTTRWNSSSAIACTIFTLALLATEFPSPATAGLITIANSGFEDPVLVDGATSGTMTPDWDRFPGAATFLNPTNVHFLSGGAPEGSNVATLNAGSGGSILSQNLAGTTLQYGTYTFEFEVGNRLDQSFHHVAFGFLVNGSIISASSSNTPTVPDGEFRTWTFTYNILNPNVFQNFIGAPTRIRFLASGSGFSSIDNVRGTFVAVPEPNALLLSASVIVFASLRLSKRERQILSRTAIRS